MTDGAVGNVLASGPGLQGSIQNHDAEFEVDTHQNPGQRLEVTVQGNKQVSIHNIVCEEEWLTSIHSPKTQFLLKWSAKVGII